MKINTLNTTIKVNSTNNLTQQKSISFGNIQDVFARQPKLFYFENKILPRHMQKQINATYQKAITKVIESKNEALNTIKNIENRADIIYEDFEIAESHEMQLQKAGQKYAKEALSLLEKGENSNYITTHYSNGSPNTIYKNDDDGIRIYTYSKEGNSDLFVLKQKDNLRIAKHTIQGLVYYDFKLSQDKKGNSVPQITQIISKPNSYLSYIYKYDNGHVTMKEEFSELFIDFTKRSYAKGYKKIHSNKNTIIKKSEEYTYDKKGKLTRYVKNSQKNCQNPPETYSLLIDFYDEDILYSENFTGENNQQSNIIARFDKKGSLEELNITQGEIETLSCHKALKYLNYVDNPTDKNSIAESFYKDENGKLQYRRLDV